LPLWPNIIEGGFFVDYGQTSRFNLFGQCGFKAGPKTLGQLRSYSWPRLLGCRWH
jgi:hypothetical protein